MDVRAAKVASIIESFGNGEISEVLVAECNDFSFSYISSELIFASGSEFAELNTGDFCSDGRCYIVGYDAAG